MELGPESLEDKFPNFEPEPNSFFEYRKLPDGEQWIYHQNAAPAMNSYFSQNLEGLRLIQPEVDKIWVPRDDFSEDIIVWQQINISILKTNTNYIASGYFLYLSQRDYPSLITSWSIEKGIPTNYNTQETIGNFLLPKNDYHWVEIVTLISSDYSQRYFGIEVEYRVNSSHMIMVQANDRILRQPYITAPENDSMFPSVENGRQHYKIILNDELIMLILSNPIYFCPGFHLYPDNRDQIFTFDDYLFEGNYPNGLSEEEVVNITRGIQYIMQYDQFYWQVNFSPQIVKMEDEDFTEMLFPISPEIAEYLHHAGVLEQDEYTDVVVRHHKLTYDLAMSKCLLHRIAHFTHDSVTCKSLIRINYINRAIEFPSPQFSMITLGLRRHACFYKRGNSFELIDYEKIYRTLLDHHRIYIDQGIFIFTCDQENFQRLIGTKLMNPTPFKDLKDYRLAIKNFIKTFTRNLYPGEKWIDSYQKSVFLPREEYKIFLDEFKEKMKEYFPTCYRNIYH